MKHAFGSLNRNKFSAKRTSIDGFTFDSKAEARRYAELKLMQRAGVIADLELQPRFDLTVNGTKVCRYEADFRYRVVSDNSIVVEDVKSPATKTPVYRIKAKLMMALHGIVIREVM